MSHVGLYISKYSIHHLYNESNIRDLEPKICNENYVD